jgi:hypothetical protein
LASSAAPITIVLVLIITRFSRITPTIATQTTKGWDEIVVAHIAELNSAGATTTVTTDLVAIITWLTLEKLIEAIATERSFLNTVRFLSFSTSAMPAVEHGAGVGAPINFIRDAIIALLMAILERVTTDGRAHGRIHHRDTGPSNLLVAVVVAPISFDRVAIIAFLPWVKESIPTIIAAYRRGASAGEPRFLPTVHITPIIVFVVAIITLFRSINNSITTVLTAVGVVAYFSSTRPAGLNQAWAAAPITIGLVAIITFFTFLTSVPAGDVLAAIFVLWRHQRSNALCAFKVGCALEAVLNVLRAANADWACVVWGEGGCALTDAKVIFEKVRRCAFIAFCHRIGLHEAWLALGNHLLAGWACSFVVWELVQGVVAK